MSQTMTRQLRRGAVDELRKAFRGPVVLPSDPDYDQVRRIWNAAVDKRPALIARCTGTADVMATVRFAREHDLELAIRGGGHNVAGSALSEGGLVADLQLMKGMRVDPDARTLVAEPGVRLGDVDHETQAFGLALVSGINSETGSSGLTLGGGIGWQMRRHGLTIDHLRGADVVTSDGELVRADRERNPDLFWALRGGGGNFGVVTSFEYDLVALGPTVYGGTVVYSADEARDVLRRYREWAASAPEAVTTILVLRRNAFPWSPPETHGMPIVGVGALYCGPAEEGQSALAPLHELGSVLATSVRPKPFTEHQSMWDASAPAGRLYYWKSHYLPALSDGLIDAINDHAWRFESPYSYALLSHMGGAIRRTPDGDSAYSGRDAEFTININCGAVEPTLYERDRAWVREWFAALTPHSTGGVYVNFLGDEGAERIRAAYGEEKYARLAALKARYDANNLFRVNQNIQPSRD